MKTDNAIFDAVNDPKEEGYYLTKTTEGKWGVALWQDGHFWHDVNQDGKMKMGIKRDFIKSFLTIKLTA